MSNKPNTRTTAKKRKPQKSGGQVVLSEFIETEREEGGLVIELADGDQIVVDPPTLWPDELTESLSGVDGNDVAAAIDAVKRLIGDDDYDRLVAEGGSATMLLQMFDRANGGSLGE